MSKPYSQLQRRILRYVEHLDDEEYWRSLLIAHSYSEILEALCGLLDDESDQVVSDACLFVVDLMLRAPDCGGRAEFVESFHASSLIAQLEMLVEAPSLSKRENAVNALGKTCSRQSAGFLRDVFVRRKKSDPLLLSGLAFEINWLLSDFDVGWYATQCLHSDSPTTRWIGLEIIAKSSLMPDDDKWQSKHAAVNSICEDPDTRVREAARFIRDEMDFEASLGQIAARAEKRRARKELDGRRPLSLEIAALSFRNKMVEESKCDYTSDDFNAYLDDFYGSR